MPVTMQQLAYRNTRYYYLASPYSDPDEAVRAARYDTISRIAARLIENGLLIYCPIIHCHSIAVKYTLPTDATYWNSANSAFIEQSGGLIVAMMPGWLTSSGIGSELQLARSLGRPVYMLDAETFDII